MLRGHWPCTLVPWQLLTDQQAPAVYRKIPVYRDWTEIPIPVFLKIKYRYFSGFWCSMCVLKLPAREDARSHWLHLFDVSPLCIIMCLLKWPAWEDAKSHWLHLFDFSRLCVFMCFFKLSAWEDAKSHWLRLFDFSPLCVFMCVLKWPALEDAKSHWLHLFDFTVFFFRISSSLKSKSSNGWL